MPTTRSRAKLEQVPEQQQEPEKKRKARKPPKAVLKAEPIKPEPEPEIPPEKQEEITDTYYTQSKGFNTAEAIAKYLKMKKEAVKQTLNKNSEIYQRTGRVLHPKRIKWIAERVGEVLHADLFFLKSRTTEKKIVGTTGQDENYIPPKKTNAAENPFLLVVDVYSRYLWIRQLKDKTGEDNRKEFLEIFQNIKETHPEIETIKVVVDDGKEFYHLKNDPIPGIKYILSKSEFGASISEAHVARVRKLIRKITGTGVLPQNPGPEHQDLPRDRRKINWNDIQTNLNNRIISGYYRKATPAELYSGEKIIEPPEETEEDESNEAEETTEKKEKPSHPFIQPEVKEKKLKVGDIVRRLETTGNLFNKKSEFIPFSKELYRITELQEYSGRFRYKLKELGKEDVEENPKVKKPLKDTRWYYYQQLKPVDIDFLKKYL